MRNLVRLIVLSSLLCAQAMAQALTPSAQPDAAPAAAPVRARASAAEVFGQLGTLIGEWKGTFVNGGEHRLTYRLSAGGSVLVETWALAPGRESMTLYHLDGDELLATHYCPQGNQPRLRWVPGNDDGRLSFVLKDGSNLDLPGSAHQHSMWLQLHDSNAYTRSETYVENGSTAEAAAQAQEGEPIVYTRVNSKRRKQ